MLIQFINCAPILSGHQYRQFALPIDATSRLRCSHLEKLRELHGLEILHDVMKHVKEWNSATKTQQRGAARLNSVRPQFCCDIIRSSDREGEHTCYRMICYYRICCVTHKGLNISAQKTVRKENFEYFVRFTIFSVLICFWQCFALVTSDDKFFSSLESNINQNLYCRQLDHLPFLPE